MPANEHNETAANRVVFFAKFRFNVEITSLTESLFGLLEAGYSSIISMAG
jgi:hypothetical protein